MGAFQTGLGLLAFLLKSFCIFWVCQYFCTFFSIYPIILYSTKITTLNCLVLFVCGLFNTGSRHSNKFLQDKETRATIEKLLITASKAAKNNFKKFR